MAKRLMECTPSEIWDSWCGSATTDSEEGQFDSLADAVAYVRDRVRDWAGEILESDEDEDGEHIRYIGDMTDEEILHVAGSIIVYSRR